jgi:hypothetical protein
MEVPLNSFTLNLVSSKLRSLVCVAALTVAGLGMAGSSIQAGDCAPAYRYEWTLCHEVRQVPYTVYETRYDHCGKAYQVRATRYRTEQVPVWRYLRVPSSTPPANIPPASTPPSDAPRGVIPPVPVPVPPM